MQNRSGIDPMYSARRRGADAADTRSGDNSLQDVQAGGSMLSALGDLRQNEQQAILGLIGLLGYYGTIGLLDPSDR